MAKALTDITIKNLRPTDVRREIPDKVPMLYCIVQPSGRRRFCLRYRIYGQSRKVTLAAGLSLAAARKIAADAALDLERGIDPRDARRTAKDKAALAQADTVRAICESYLKREGPKLRTLGQRVRLLKAHVYPAFGDRPIGSVRRGEVVRLLDKIEDNSGARTADVVLTILRRVFNWHAIRDESFVPPLVRGMTRHSNAQHARARVLDDSELRRVWCATEAPTPYNALTRFLLLTACRRGEAVGMTWGEIVGDAWVLPALRNKTGQELRRPLSRAALAALEAKPRIAGCPYVFTRGRGPLGALSKGKSELDKASGVAGWRLHDLRRTSRSLLSRAGINADVAERCLGHTIGGVRGTYDRHQYQAEMLHAFEALAAQIERIIDPKENVVRLARR